MRYAQIVIGPAGCGKSTYCSTILAHTEAMNRPVKVINLDPAAEYFDYAATADIKDLISLEDAMSDEELRFGPNGGLIFCMEYLVENNEWLEESVGTDEDDDYILFDCPGQIELYTHMTVMKKFVDILTNWNFNVCCVYLLDSQFMIDSSKYISGVMTALSAMTNIETPHVNILSKIDLLSKRSRKKLKEYLEPGMDIVPFEEDSAQWNNKHLKLSQTIAKLIDDYSLVRFIPLNSKDEDSISDVLLYIDTALQFGEDADVKMRVSD
ncbi:GPN-loop GTPase 3 [Nymphon striatum]|nr:GPN-loop GTPase 3 [Nymphon striatum]